MARRELRDDQWNKIKDLLPGKKTDPGRSQGGLATKIHTATDALGNPLTSSPAYVYTKITGKEVMIYKVTALSGNDGGIIGGIGIIHIENRYFESA